MIVVIKFSYMFPIYPNALRLVANRNPFGLCAVWKREIGKLLVTSCRCKSRNDGRPVGLETPSIQRNRKVTIRWCGQSAGKIHENENPQRLYAELASLN